MAKREIHNAIVTRNVDPDLDPELGETLKGAVFFEAKTLFEGEYPTPALPCFPHAGANGAGFFFVPEVGDEIEVEIYVDDPNSPYDTTDTELPEPRWRCMVYSDAADIDDEFKVNYPNRMGWKSKTGNMLMFDDTEGEELVRLAHMVGTVIEMDRAGNWLETIVRDKIVEVLRNQDTFIQGEDNLNVMKNRLVDVRKDETHRVRGNYKVEVGGDFEQKIRGKQVFEINDLTQNIGLLKQNISGSKEMKVGGGYKKVVGGGASESVVSNRNISCAANETKLVAGLANHTYGTGKTETVALGNCSLLLVAGNMLFNVTAGNILLSTLAGMASFGNLVGNIVVTPAGNMTILSPLVTVGAGAGMVLTTVTSPVVDTITGMPTIGVPTFLV